MAGRRLLYLAVLESLLVFYVAYREWFSWLILVAVAAFPLLSLLLSLPAILTARVTLNGPDRVTMGEAVRPALQVDCKLPAPPVRCRLKLRHSITAEQLRWRQGTALPTEHCGSLHPQKGGVWSYDYLGLWRFPVRKSICTGITILPVPVPIEQLPGLRQAVSWKPKRAGFAENHELRLYRPGDELRQLHWKLSAKTGKLIVREPMEPVRRRLLITMVLPNTPEQADLQLGQLSWLSALLVEKELHHSVRCLTDRGLESFRITDEKSRQEALCKILTAQPPAGSTMPAVTDADWHFHIGGDRHEG